MSIKTAEQEILVIERKSNHFAHQVTESFSNNNSSTADLEIEKAIQERKSEERGDLPEIAVPKNRFSTVFEEFADFDDHEAWDFHHSFESESSIPQYRNSLHCQSYSDLSHLYEELERNLYERNLELQGVLMEKDELISKQSAFNRQIKQLLTQFFTGKVNKHRRN